MSYFNKTEKRLFTSKVAYFGRSERRLGLLIGLHTAVCCISLVVIATGVVSTSIDPDIFHIHFQVDRSWTAIVAVTLFSSVSVLFLFCPFSFGYFVAFYFYSMIASYVWLTVFSDFSYNHLLAGSSAAISCLAFSIPALLLSRPAKQSFEIPTIAADHGVSVIIGLVTIVLGLGAYYNLSLSLSGDLANLRETIQIPRPISYLIWTSSGALLPFAFAYSLARKWYGHLIYVVLLQLLLFPITLTKTALFAPAWLAFLHLLSVRTSPRNVVVLSLLSPAIFGLLLLFFGSSAAALPFSIINFRMLAIPALAMDVYNDFFSRNPLTYFCQVTPLKAILTCPYTDQLSTIMHSEYHLGNFNASLFATEGIASVGMWLAPFSALVCGVITSFANRASAGLPPRFVLVSGGMLPQIMLNVPFSVAILTHGAALLCLLWCLTPRQVFAPPR
ncbi:hypothetical protein ACVWZ6_007016 [Bradyrhizobium sp. GM6.1]